MDFYILPQKHLDFNYCGGGGDDFPSDRDVRILIDNQPLLCLTKYSMYPPSLLTYISPLTKTGLLPHTRSGWTLNIHTNIDYQFVFKKKQFGKLERPQIYNVASIV